MSKVVVTGASGGLGREVCKALAEKRLDIIAVDIRSKDEILQELSTIKDRVVEVYSNVDFSDVEAVQDLAGQLIPDSEWTTLVNNAGISIGGKLHDATFEEWQAMMSVNLTAPFLLSQAFFNNATNQDLQGSIINISSMVGIIGTKKPGYAASKAGILGLTKATAKQAGPKVRCNAIYPGAMDTPMTADWDKQTREMIANKTPLKRIADPQEIATIVAFLADSSQSGFMTGAVLNATGGQYLGQ